MKGDIVVLFSSDTKSSNLKRFANYLSVPVMIRSVQNFDKKQ